MPLFVRAEHKLSLSDTVELMRTHFEGTWFDNRAWGATCPRPQESHSLCSTSPNLPLSQVASRAPMLAPTLATPREWAWRLDDNALV